MRTKFYILSIFIILSISIWSENKTYITTLYTTPTHQQIALPVMINKTNLNGDNFSNKDLLATFISQPSITEYTEVLKADMYDRFHLQKATRDARFYYLSFRLSANKYNRASLRITAPSMYEVYINDTKEVAKTTIEDSLSNAKVTKINFSVLPSSTYNVVIKYMSLASNKAPEDIYISVQPEDDKQSVDYFFSKAGEKRSITIRDILEGKRINSTNISPDGNFVLLKYTTTKKDGKTYSDNILMSLKDTKEIILSPYQSYAWMPATNKLYYSDNRSGENKLILVDPNTLEETVFANDIPEGWFYFTPDEKELIYLVEEKAKSPSSDLILLTAPESVQPRNGDRTFLAQYDLSTGVQQRLTFGKNSTKIQDISSDSRFILYSVTEYDATRRPFNFNSLYKLNLIDLSVDTLFTNQGFASSAEFSPDGSKILILGSAEAFDGIGNTLPATEIPNAYNKLAFVMDIVSKKITVITKDFVPSVDRAYWSRHDGLIYLQATDKDYVKVYTYDTKSKKITSLNLDEDIVSAFDLSTKSSKAVYYGMSASNFTKAYTLDLKNGKSTLISDPDKELIDQLNLSKITDWSFTSSTGTTIDGRYYLPPNFDASKKYPLIVYYYGGTVPTPRTLSAPYPAQVYAALGYVVYVLQPSGAIGYGPQFAARHVNGWGKENANDIIEGTKKFIEEHSFVNEKKIGCIGASYGGYMTMYLQTQTDLFAAAVSHAGISSISSYWGEGYWGYTYSSGASAGSYPWNNPELYVKQSPLFNADKINTPLLLLHGTVDTNVPIGESMQMYTALKILGKPVEFIQVKGEDHGIKNFKKRIEWNNSIYAWFAKWLQDDSSWWDNLYKTN